MCNTNGKPITAAVLDWNGTTLDDLGLAYKSIRCIFEHYGISPPTLEQFRREMSQEWMKFYLNHGIPEGTTPDALNVIRRKVLESSWNSVKLHLGVHEFMDLIRTNGAETLLVSGEVQEILDRRLWQFDVGHYYDRVIGSVYKKTEFLTTLGLVPEETLYVDDDPHALTGAKELGFVTIGVTHGYASEDRIRAAEPDCVAQNFTDAIEFVKAKFAKVA